jgi:leucyl aminopeptidase
MKISVTTSDPCALTADCLIVGIHQDTPVTGVAAAVNRATKGLVKRLLDRNDMDGTAGRCVMLPLDTGVNAQRLLLVGLGKPGTARDFETAVRGAAETLGRSGSRNAVFALTSSGRRAAETAQQARLVAQGFSDAQCGFKAITRAAARELVPLVEDNGWFFDTELLLEAERLGHRIVDVPVEWREDADSRVRVVATAWGDLKGLLRMRWRRLVGPGGCR